MITNIIYPAFTVFSLCCFAVLPGAQGQCVDGCGSNFGTFQGDGALISNNTGAGNTAFGWRSLFSDSDGSFNTGVGGGALVLNNGSSNTGVGAAALLLNTTGTENTAVGTDALVFNEGGNFNGAVGAFALFNNIDGVSNNAFGDEALTSNLHASQNTAVGDLALFNNDSTGNGLANGNTAVGASALFFNTDGINNTALGFQALIIETTAGFCTAVGWNALEFGTGPYNTAVGQAALQGASGSSTGDHNSAFGSAALANNTTGNYNSAVGADALSTNTDGSSNTAVGHDALSMNTTGISNVGIGDLTLSSANSSYNTAVGYQTGLNITTSGFDENIYIGDSAGTVDFLGNILGNEAGVIRIGSFFSGTAACFINGIANNGPFTDTVTIDPATGQLGGLPSSARFKKDIEPMDKTSEVIYSLKPVTFHYKKDKTNTPWFGLIAEDVAKVNSALIGVDSEGKPYCVAYDKVNAMLLNEFLKEHRVVEEQGAMIARQQKQIEALTAAVQKVNTQLELSKSAPQTVLNSQ